jgi:hypothetical protein
MSSAVDPGAHAVLIVDRAGWHLTPKLVVPSNIPLLFLPPLAPDLTQSRTCGSSCATTGSPTASSLTTTTLSPTSAPLGIS